MSSARVDELAARIEPRASLLVTYVRCCVIRTPSRWRTRFETRALRRELVRPAPDTQRMASPSHFQAVVEVMGLEPTTSTLRTFPRPSREQRGGAKAQVKRH